MDSIINHRLYSEIDSGEFVQRSIDTWNAFRPAIAIEKDAILYFMEFLPHLSKPDLKFGGDLCPSTSDPGPFFDL